MILDENWLFVLGRQELAAYDLDTGERLYRRGGAGENVESTADRNLIAVHEGGRVTVLDTDSWVEVIRIATRGRVRGLAFNADGSRLAIGEPRTLRIVDTATGQAIQEMALTNVSDIHWIDDETLVVATADGVVGTVSLSTNDFLATVRGALARSFTDAECERYRIAPCPTLAEMRAG